jgi:hypothetical protein
MAMRRRTLLVVLAGLAVVVATGVFVLWPKAQPDRITQENFARVADGMSHAEVEAILGPPGDHRTAPTEATTDFVFFSADGTKIATPDVWRGDRANIYVAYDLAGCVMGKSSHANNRFPQSPLDNLLWRAKRQWHRWFP